VATWPHYIVGVCGRFTYKLTWEELVRPYRLTLDQPARNTLPRYNVCPTDPVDTIIAPDGKRDLVPMRWGLVPRRWNKSLKEAKMATFNVRAETVETKPLFRDAFKRTRCLIPMSGCYEWQATPSDKQPWYFTARNGSPALTALATIAKSYGVRFSSEKRPTCRGAES
jgi:putative SOS response-associated peptidase YedK